MKLHLICPEAIDGYWPHVAGMLFPALERTRGLYQAEDIVGFLKSGAQQLWLVVRGEKIDGALVTEIVRYPRAKCCWIAFAGGEGIHDCPEVLEVIQDWARDLGCTAMRTEGRKGWVRAAGFKEVGSVLWKEIAK